MKECVGLLVDTDQFRGITLRHVHPSKGDIESLSNEIDKPDCRQHLDCHVVIAILEFE